MKKRLVFIASMCLLILTNFSLVFTSHLLSFDNLVLTTADDTTYNVNVKPLNSGTINGDSTGIPRGFKEDVPYSFEGNVCKVGEYEYIASPSEGYEFVGWQIDGQQATGGIIHCDLEIVAVFRKISYNLQIVSGNNGVIDGYSEPISMVLTGETIVIIDKNRIIICNDDGNIDQSYVAVPNDGYKLVRWNGIELESSVDDEAIINKDTIITAEFSLIDGPGDYITEEKQKIALIFGICAGSLALIGIASIVIIVIVKKKKFD